MSVISYLTDGEINSFLLNEKVSDLELMFGDVFALNAGHGLAHIIVDGAALDNAAIDFCLEKIHNASFTENYTEKECRAELKLCTALKNATLKERVSAYALFEGLIQIDRDYYQEDAQELRKDW